MKKYGLICLCLIVMSGSVWAKVIRGIDIDFVSIGNAGNTADSSGFGAVDYAYQIGRYEITNNQWNAFVSAAGKPTGSSENFIRNPYDESAKWTRDLFPTNGVSWPEAAQFCNYLTSGDKYSGAYNFDSSGVYLGADRTSAISTYGTTYVIPNNDEWYKAAYYTGSGYSLYANGSITAPIEDIDSNYGYEDGTYPWNVGTGTMEQNGTFDMMGNVWEWSESIVDSRSFRRLWGGSYYGQGIHLSSSTYASINPGSEFDYIGFRIASVPEPASMVLIGLGGVLLKCKRFC